MRWDDIIPAVVATLRGYTPLVNALGGADRIDYMRSGQTVQVPSLRWFIVADTEGELWNGVLVQFTLWAEKPADMASIEGALRDILRSGMFRDVEGVTLATNFVDSTMLDVPAGMNPGTVHKAVDYRFTALKSKYARA